MPGTTEGWGLIVKEHENSGMAKHRIYEERVVSNEAENMGPVCEEP